jgi:hypothetical protein
MLFLVRCDELVALAVDVDDLNLVVVFQVLAQLGDVRENSGLATVIPGAGHGVESLLTL